MKLTYKKDSKWFYVWHLMLVVIGTCFVLSSFGLWNLVQATELQIILIKVCWGLAVVTCIEQLWWTFEHLYYDFVLKKELRE